MGTIFANAPIVPTVVEVPVLRIYFDAPCRYCRRRATTNIRPVDAIGAPMVADLFLCDAHAEQLVARARAKNLEVSPWPPAD
jgi:hypothetical protein